MAVPLSGGCCLLALCHASSRAEAVCFSKGNVAVRSWAGLQPGFISFTPRLAGPHGRMTKEGAAVRAPCRYTSTVAKMRISPRKEQSRGRSCPAACTSHASSVAGFFLVLFTRMAMMRAVRLIAKRPQSARGRASFGAEYRYYARANTLLTDLAYACPPRGVLMPRALRASAV